MLSGDPPSRGGAGTVVRMVGLATATGATVLVAEDRFYDLRPATPVSPPGLRQPRPSARIRSVR